MINVYHGDFRGSALAPRATFARAIALRAFSRRRRTRRNFSAGNGHSSASAQFRRAVLRKPVNTNRLVSPSRCRFGAGEKEGCSRCRVRQRVGEKEGCLGSRVRQRVGEKEGCLRIRVRLRAGEKEGCLRIRVRLRAGEKEGCVRIRVRQRVGEKEGCLRIRVRLRVGEKEGCPRSRVPLRVGECAFALARRKVARVGECAGRVGAACLVAFGLRSAREGPSVALIPAKGRLRPFMRAHGALARHALSPLPCARAAKGRRSRSFPSRRARMEASTDARMKDVTSLERANGRHLTLGSESSLSVRNLFARRRMAITPWNGGAGVAPTTRRSRSSRRELRETRETFRVGRCRSWRAGSSTAPCPETRTRIRCRPR
jgi:hypothetical protein